MNYCKNCGNQITPGNNFCVSCGSPVDGVQQPDYNQPVQQEQNGFAIAGLICSIVVGSITGLIFSIIGLNKAKKQNGNGKGLAIAGIVISAIRLAIFAIVIFGTMYSALAWPATKQSILRSAHCSEAFECKDNNDGTLSCVYLDEYSIRQPITCPSNNR